MSNGDGPDVQDMHLGDPIDPYSHLNKSLRKFTEYCKEHERLELWMTEALGRIHKNRMYWKEQVRLASVLISEQTGKSRIPTPNGYVSLTRSKGKFEITDRPAAMEWLKQNVPEQEAFDRLTKSTLAIRAGELRKVLERDDGTLGDCPFATLTGAGEQSLSISNTRPEEDPA